MSSITDVLNQNIGARMGHRYLYFSFPVSPALIIKLLVKNF